MVSFTHTVEDPQGLHARPIAQMVAALMPFESEVRIAVGDRSADGRDLMGLMGLDAMHGEVLEVSVEGADEDTAVDALRAVLP